MGDVALNSTYDGGDILVTSGEVVIDNGLHTAIVISLLTDVNADGNGFWGDVLNETGGSQIHTLRKNSVENRNLLVRYVQNALQWLVTEDVASSVDVSVSSYTAQNVSILIHITEPDIDFLYSVNWDNMQEDIRSL